MVLCIRLTSFICFFSLIALLSGCSSTSSSSSQSEGADEDIYASLKDDKVQYRDGRGQNAQVSDQKLVSQQVTEIRTLYFRREYTAALEKAERLLRLEPNSGEAYYWLARIYMDQADYSQAYNMATKGLSVTGNPNLKRELERVQSQAQMGNY